MLIHDHMNLLWKSNLTIDITLHLLILLAINSCVIYKTLLSARDHKCCTVIYICPSYL